MTFSEKVISLADAVKILPRTQRNKHLCYSTIYRWILSGLRSRDRMVVRLEAVKIGGITCTSHEALQRFFDRLSGDATVVTPPTTTQRQRLRQIAAAEEELRRAGI